MSYVERLKALIIKRGGSTVEVNTVSDAISVLESLEEKKAPASHIETPVPD